MKTFIQKKAETSKGYIDRQNTKWAKEISSKCDHKWIPISMSLNGHGTPDLISARTYCICMECCSHTYIETGYVGFFIGSPDELESE